MRTNPNDFVVGQFVIEKPEYQTHRLGIVLGPSVWIGQWWTPMIWIEEDDPTIHKFGALKPIRNLSLDLLTEILDEAQMERLGLVEAAHD